MKKYISLVVVSIWFTMGASAQRVEVTKSKTADFGQFRTFFLKEGDLVLVMPESPDARQLKEYISNAIQEEMTEKGYSGHSDSTADLSVSYVAEIVERIEQANLGPLGEAPARSGADLDQPRTWSQEIRRGSLAIEVFDSKTGESVWRSRSEINFRSADLNEVLNAAVGRSMRKFPKSKK